MPSLSLKRMTVCVRSVRAYPQCGEELSAMNMGGMEEMGLFCECQARELCCLPLSQRSSFLSEAELLLL